MTSGSGEARATRCSFSATVSGPQRTSAPRWTWPRRPTTSRPAPTRSSGSAGSNDSTGSNGRAPNPNLAAAPPPVPTAKPATSGPDASADASAAAQLDRFGLITAASSRGIPVLAHPAPGRASGADEYRLWWVAGTRVATLCQLPYDATKGRAGSRLSALDGAAAARKGQTDEPGGPVADCGDGAVGHRRDRPGGSWVHRVRQRPDRTAIPAVHTGSNQHRPLGSLPVSGLLLA